MKSETLNEHFRMDRMSSIVPNHRMDSLRGFTAFLHAVEQRSYVAAARLLGVSPSAISKSVSRLEDRLGVRLLNRTTRSIGVTEEGAVFYERCKRVLDDISDVKDTMRRSANAPKGKLKISVPHVFGQHMLLPLLPEFSERYPEIELDVEFDDQVVDLVANGIDVAIRTGDLADTRLVARKISDQRFVVCGSPEYLRLRGVPESPEDLHQHSCIQFKYPSSGRKAPWSFRDPHTNCSVSRSLVFNSTEAGLWAALHGMGLAHLPEYAVNARLQSGELRAVLTEYMQPFGSLWLVWPSNRQLSPKVRAFADHVVKTLNSTNDPAPRS